MPQDESKFISILRDARREYEAGSNDMAKGAARPARGAALCAALQSPVVSGWVGRIYKLSSNSEGKGVLELEVDPSSYVKTWNNALSDMADETLIEPSSRVFRKAVALKEGQWIKFSGTLIPDQTDCFKEGSVGLRGSIQEPEFIFKFSDVVPL